MHKLRGTVPAEAVMVPRHLYRLHDKIKEQIRLIKDEPRYEKRMSYQSRKDFEHLKDLVWQWGDGGEWTKRNRVEIRKVVSVLQFKGTLPWIGEGKM